MSKAVLILGLMLSLNSSVSARTIILKNHSWPITDISLTPYHDQHILRSLKTDWDPQALEEDLAHLYSFQIQRKFGISTAKIFLFEKPNLTHTAVLINESESLLALDHHQQRFIHIDDWIFQRSGRRCSELSNPSEQAILLMQINQFNPGNSCYFMIVPGHVWQRLELYPTSTPKDFSEEDLRKACYDSTTKSIFTRDGQACKKWIEKLK